MEHKDCKSDPKLKIWFEIIRIYQQFQSKINSNLNDYELSLPQMDMLATLFFNGQLNQQELSEKLLVTKGNICGLVDRLTEKDLVERKSCNEDRRINHVCITEKGKDLINNVMPSHHDLINSFTSSLNDEEKEILFKLLQKL
ncbi:MAG: MarR family transcriptional regulator [Candidatus Sericytochromatia bacterium]